MTIPIWCPVALVWKGILIYIMQTLAVAYFRFVFAFIKLSSSTQFYQPAIISYYTQAVCPLQSLSSLLPF